MRVLVTGGAGYVGSALVPALLARGHEVLVYDTFWFGDHLPRAGSEGTTETEPAHLRLVKRRGDIRDISEFRRALRSGRFADSTYGVDVVIHLACLSNDPSAEVDRNLTRSINYDAFEPLVVAARDAGVRRFINCSTSSVYGVSDAPDVREDHPHVPLTLYNTYKSECEAIFTKYAEGSERRDDFECVTIRPSTVCGYAPRQRLDLAVNILTNLAYNKGVITVYGGEQTRPNLHIRDMVACYVALLDAPADEVAGQTFNVGAGNISIMALAEKVRGFVRSKGEYVAIDVQPIKDERSYQVNSDKIRDVLGFVPRLTVDDAIAALWSAFDGGLLPNAMEDSRYYNVRRMKEVFADLYKGAPPSAFRPEEGHLSEIDTLYRGASDADKVN
jgi:nucleoside-diphosphate-sugar epimerase